MRRIDLNDLSFAAKLKSDLMILLWDLEKESLPQQENFIDEFRSVIGEFIEFESILQESFKPNSYN
ncbi:hypothetical protein MKX34_11945 [Paenibacillus sp. FSL R5-0636]|uniref:Uncharacterized protein n=1 Tax=Paenibacillus odorifer TaxID=189426 RepID=A0AB36J2I7_9BACL|nr:hypothetical protein [Paenibacillus odorifer]OMC99906.1 hypothetical protein BJP49_28745 [Paenibacillus odorifer]OME07061.1 hypothetical protein BSK60_31830 [Paenibacillus odorifer]OME09724.1 hypothetical protein BSK47_31830 [Paenibacillus odorifer]